MPRFLSCLLLIAGIFYITTLSAQTDTRFDAFQSSTYGMQSANKLYEQNTFYFNQLENNSSLARSRDNWLKGTRNFRKAYLSSPKSEQAPYCVYALGDMYLKMYKRFSLGIDLDESLSYFKDTSRLFPEHSLADDALYSEASIYLEYKKDPKNASTALRKIVSQYPNGDMHSKAADKLKVLSKDFDIPLPKSLIGSTQLNTLTTIHPVKFWSSPDYARVVVMADGLINYKEVILKEKSGSPRKLYIDFQNSYIAPEQRRKIVVEDGFLKQISIDQLRSDTVRVYLNVNSIDNYKIFSLPNPFRIIIDVRRERPVVAVQPQKRDIKEPKITSAEERLQPVISTQNAASTTEKKVPPSAIKVIRNEQRKQIVNRDQILPKEDSIPEKQKKISLAQQLGLGVKKIILDPGHGGKDPGAIANGMQEKDIVLRLAQELKPRLQMMLNCEVLLTRNNDIFLPLEERTAIANTEEADLFISLHLNAHPSPDTRGIETYFLNLSTNAEAMRVAAMENSTSTHQMSDLEGILSDILKNSKIDESSRLAKYVHTSMLTGLNSKTFGEIKNLGVKQAPFYVLIGAQMPAILIEIAFISNKVDAENLKNQQFIESIATEIGKGIGSYIQNNTASL